MRVSSNTQWVDPDIVVFVGERLLMATRRFRIGASDLDVL
jgi:hypothetical protein